MQKTINVTSPNGVQFRYFINEKVIRWINHAATEPVWKKDDMPAHGHVSLVSDVFVYTLIQCNWKPRTVICRATEPANPDNPRRYHYRWEPSGALFHVNDLGRKFPIALEKRYSVIRSLLKKL